LLTTISLPSVTTKGIEMVKSAADTGDRKNNRIVVSVIIILTYFVMSKQHDIKTLKAKFHDAIWFPAGRRQVQSWSQTCSQLNFGLF